MEHWIIGRGGVRVGPAIRMCLGAEADSQGVEIRAG